MAAPSRGGHPLLPSRKTNPDTSCYSITEFDCKRMYLVVFTRRRRLSMLKRNTCRQQMKSKAYVIYSGRSADTCNLAQCVLQLYVF